MKFIGLTRPERSILAAAAVWIGTIVAGSSFIPELEIIYALASAFAIAAGGFAANDYFDAESDKLNNPKRLVASGKIGKNAAIGISAVFFIIGVALSYMISFDALAVAVIASGLFIAYSAVLKHTMLIGNLLVGGLAALAFFFGGLVAGNHTAALPVSLFVFISAAGREIYSSIDSSLADRRYEEKSIAMKLGVTNARIIANIFLIAAVVFSFIPYIIGVLGMTYLFFILLADIILLASAVVPVKYSSKLILIGIIVGIFAFFAAAVA